MRPQTRLRYRWHLATRTTGDRAVFSILASIILAASYVFATPASAASLLPSPLEIVDQVSQTDYQHYLDDRLYTRTGDNRGSGPEHDLARASIYSELESFGLETSLQSSTDGSGYISNVVGVHYGMTRPDDIYILGAHYDSVSNPGADDNASGVAGVLEAASVLSQYEFEATLIFLAFDREEVGLQGSSLYASAHQYDNILGMISMDMIAYNSDIYYNVAGIAGRDSSMPLKSALADAISLYGNGLSPDIRGRMGRSDHASFEQYGFQAALLIEASARSNPHYHRLSDTVDTPGYIDYEYATNMVRSSVGYFATAAVPIPEPSTVLLLGVGLIILKMRARR